MNSFVHSGVRIPYANTGSLISSGGVVVLGVGPNRFIGVAVADIAATTGTGELAVDGVFALTFLSTDTGSVGDVVWWDTANSRCTVTRSSTTVYAGRLALAKGNGDTTGNVRLNDVGRLTGLLYNQVAAGTALTASSTETALGAFTIPANVLKVGDKLRIRYQGIATATNSTDTLAVKLYIGGLSGTALISHAATDVANNDVFSGEYELTVRTIGASGTIVGCGTYKSVPAAEGTATYKDDILASTAIDTTAAQDITVSGTWSTTNAGNSCRLDVLSVELVG